MWHGLIKIYIGIFTSLNVECKICIKESIKKNINIISVNTFSRLLQYILANPNSPVPLRKNIVRISEIALFSIDKNNTNICDSQILCNFVVYPLLITLKL